MPQYRIGTRTCKEIAAIINDRGMVDGSRPERPVTPREVHAAYHRAIRKIRKELDSAIDDGLSEGPAKW